MLLNGQTHIQLRYQCSCCYEVTCSLHWPTVLCCWLVDIVAVHYCNGPSHNQAAQTSLVKRILWNSYFTLQTLFLWLVCVRYFQWIYNFFHTKYTIICIQHPVQHLNPLKATLAPQFSSAEDGWKEKVESQRAFCVAALTGVSNHQHSKIFPLPPICGPVTVGTMYRTSWTLFKIGAQLTLQVPVPKY